MTLRPDTSPCTIGDVCDFESGNGFGPQDWKPKGLPIIRIQNLNGADSFNYFDGEPDPAWLVEPNKSDFKTFGKNITLFPGVADWFKRLNAYARSKGVRLEHFIISSGIREMVEGTPIYKEFKKVYASGFMFDHNGVACWPALAVNYTTKTQYLFRINKGSLDVHDNSVINKFVPKDQRPVPFENMVFIGDGETDIPCMRLVKDQGGHSIAVYHGTKRGVKKHAEQLVTDGRATLAAPADFQEGSTIDTCVKAIIDKVEAAARIRGA